MFGDGEGFVTCFGYFLFEKKEKVKGGMESRVSFFLGLYNYHGGSLVCVVRELSNIAMYRIKSIHRKSYLSLISSLICNRF